MCESKWNRGRSIPISNLTAEELKQAMKCWAEGSDELERLLWNCYNNGIKTNGCDSGNHGHFAYLGCSLNDGTPHELIKRMLSETEQFGNANVQINFGSNPMSGPNWYEDIITFSPIYRYEADAFFSSLNSAISEKDSESSSECFAKILDLYDFLKDKDSGLKISMEVNSLVIYKLNFHCFLNRYNWKYFAKLFEKAGLTQATDIPTNAPVMEWGIKTTDVKTLRNAVDTVLEVFKNHWNLEIPEPYEISLRDTSFNYLALLMHRKFGVTPEGIKAMNDWINANNPDPNARKVSY